MTFFSELELLHAKDTGPVQFENTVFPKKLASWPAFTINGAAGTPGVCGKRQWGGPYIKSKQQQALENI